MIYQAKHQKRRKDSFIRRLMALFLVIILTLSVLSLDNLFSLFPVRAVAAENGLAEHIIDTVSPAHVTFNLFDYWVDAQNSRYNQNWDVQKGINQGHPFLFSDGAEGRGPWNVWTGNPKHYNAAHPEETRYGVYPGIVNQSLQNGYPTLALEDDYPQKGQPTFITNNHLQDKLTESLAYLFDPDVSNDYKAVYENVQGLVKYDGNGGYVYNSHQNYAAFQKSDSGTLGTNGEPSAGYFDVYDNWGLTSGGSPNGQFFPFDGADEVFATDTNGNYQVGDDGKLVPKGNVALDGNTTTLNHYMGLTMETVFLQPENGKIDASTPMSFSFSGDDDVWIFIDGVLVSDLGGIHDECFTIIDFEQGMVYTGLTPMVQNVEDNSFSEDIPTLEELRTNGADVQTWTWFDRTQDSSGHRAGTKNGSYDEFKAAHDITSTTLKAIFEAAGQSGTQAWGDESGMSANTFDQNTQHELKMFYLERGAGASNLVLEFNMLAVPASGITKTDQDGNPVFGATFELWPAKVSDTKKDENDFAAPVLGEDGLYVADKSSGAPICTATTDASGQLNFITENRKIISFQERAQRADPQLYYVLEETGLPPGYRSKGNISLYYSIYNQQTKEGVLLSYNYWETGAYTQAKLDVTMTEELYEYTVQGGQAVAGAQIGAGQADIAEYLDNGVIFAVPIKRIDMNGSLYDESNFYALYGTMNSGWTMMHNPISDKASVLEAAKGMVRVMQENHQSGTIIAERNARQLFHVEVSNIPGDVKLSYHYLEGSKKEKDAQYNVAFYFAPDASSLDDVDPDKIVRIATATPDGHSFERQYASQFYVPNTFNRVRVQKLNYQGERLAGAEFTMYQTYSTQPRANYERVGENSEDTGHIGLYRNTAVVNEDGTLKDRTEILKTTPWDKGETMSEGSTGTGGLDLDGAIIFPTAFDKYAYSGQTGGYRVNPSDTSTYMEEGEYVILETSAPAGYEANDAPITVTVNDDGVFADAGEINDGVRVGQYTGWILNSLSQFAAEGPVDATLTFVKTNLKVIDEDGTLKSPVEGDMTWQNKYSNQNHRYISLAEDVGRYITAGRNLYQYTDEGTPRLVIQQNQDVKAQVIVLLGTDATNDGAHYPGPVTVNKKNEDDTIYSLDGWATNGTLAFWLRKEGTADGVQTLDSVEIDGKKLELNKDYRVYTPNVNDLSAYDDLSGLFSVETLVQVFDQGYGSLAVTKETENTPEGSALKEDEIFHFRVYSSYENATKAGNSGFYRNLKRSFAADGQRRPGYAGYGHHYRSGFCRR